MNPNTRQPLYMFSRPLAGEESQMNPSDPFGFNPFRVVMYGAPPPPEPQPIPPMSPFHPIPVPPPYQIPKPVDATPSPAVSPETGSGEHSPLCERPATRREVLAASEATRAALRELEAKVEVLTARISQITDVLIELLAQDLEPENKPKKHKRSEKKVKK